MAKIKAESTDQFDQPKVFVLEWLSSLNDVPP